MGRLSTHVLDTAHGLPASGVDVSLSRLDGTAWRELKRVRTNADGRTDEPLLAGDALVAGVYRLEFAIGEHFRRSGMKLAEPPFVDHVVLQVGIADASAHYHVPLLASPWSYSTYRGS
jgi:5-hydroxyisourate hydrolase